MCPMVRWMVLAKVMLAIALTAGEQAMAQPFQAPIQRPNQPVLCGVLLENYSDAERYQISQRLRLFEGGAGHRNRPWCAHLGFNVSSPASGCTKAVCSRRGECNYCFYVDFFAGYWGVRAAPSGCLRYRCTEFDYSPLLRRIPR
jgi:hypothetical protein